MNLNFKNQFQIGQANITLDSFETKTKEDGKMSKKQKIKESKTMSLTKDRPNSSRFKNINTANFAQEQP